MTSRLGRRHERTTVRVSARALPDESLGDHQANNEIRNLLRQHFESSFEPLQIAQAVPFDNEDSDSDDSILDDSEPEWQGLSENEDEGPGLDVHHVGTPPPKTGLSAGEKKDFMTAKPPLSSASLNRIVQPKPSDPDVLDATSESANLKKDLALQRLLKESHLLDSQSSLAHRGINRHKALDLRLQDIGSKSSIFSQENMPLTQRRGINAKAKDKEESRRREAQANGIILESSSKGKRRGEIRREKGIGAPSVGKFQGGILKLSKKDVASIEGPKKTTKGRR